MATKTKPKKTKAATKATPKKKHLAMTQEQRITAAEQRISALLGRASGGVSTTIPIVSEKLTWPIRIRDGAVGEARVADGAAHGVTFNSGTKRQSRKPLYHLVPIELMTAVADTRQHGDLKYEPGNWRKGDRAFFIDCINHTIEHLLGAAGQDVELTSVETIETHLAHAACNIGFILYALRRGIISRADFDRAAVILHGKPTLEALESARG